MKKDHYRKFNPKWGGRGEKGRDWRSWDPRWSWRGALVEGTSKQGVWFQTYWKCNVKERGVLEYSGGELGRRLRVRF